MYCSVSCNVYYMRVCCITWMSQLCYKLHHMKRWSQYYCGFMLPYVWFLGVLYYAIFIFQHVGGSRITKSPNWNLISLDCFALPIWNLSSMQYSYTSLTNVTTETLSHVLTQSVYKWKCSNNQFWVWNSNPQSIVVSTTIKARVVLG